jgi:hypothetical protein
MEHVNYFAVVYSDSVLRLRRVYATVLRQLVTVMCCQLNEFITMGSVPLCAPDEFFVAINEVVFDGIVSLIHS